MTWQEFKTYLESHGVTEDMELDFIDVSGDIEIEVTITSTSFKVENNDERNW